MSYRHPWAKTFETYELKIIRTEFGKPPPRVCELHEKCFRADGTVPATYGGWGLVDPLNLVNELPGVNPKLLTMSIKGLVQGGGYGTGGWSRLILLLDRAEVLRRELQHGADWLLNKFVLNRDVSGVTYLDLDFTQYAFIFLPGAGVIFHDAEIIIDGEYYTDMPPETASVKITVTNGKTGALVKGAYVALMSGARIAADGYTDGGVVLFENVDVGGYTIKVLAGGYYDFEQSLKVEAPSVWYIIKLVPIPVPPIPPWAWWVVGGVAALGAITVVPSIIRRKEERVIVVK